METSPFEILLAATNDGFAEVLAAFEVEPTRLPPAALSNGVYLGAVGYGGNAVRGTVLLVAQRGLCAALVRTICGDESIEPTDEELCDVAGEVANQRSEERRVGKE